MKKTFEKTFDGIDWNKPLYGIVIQDSSCPEYIDDNYERITNNKQDVIKRFKELKAKESPGYEVKQVEEIRRCDWSGIKVPDFDELIEGESVYIGFEGEEENKARDAWECLRKKYLDFVEDMNIWYFEPVRKVYPKEVK